MKKGSFGFHLHVSVNYLRAACSVRGAPREAAATRGSAYVAFTCTAKTVSARWPSLATDLGAKSTLMRDLISRGLEIITAAPAGCSGPVPSRASRGDVVSAMPAASIAAAATSVGMPSVRPACSYARKVCWKLRRSGLPGTRRSFRASARPTHHQRREGAAAWHPNRSVRVLRRLLQHPW